MNGGVNGWGTVFELSHTKTGWEEKVIYTFSWTDGANPIAGVIFDKSGNLIGTTALGGSNGSGTVFELTLSGGRWTQTILHNFTGYPDDGIAPNSLLASDNLGNLYGTTEYGGSSDQCGSDWGEGCGTAFELTPSSGGWSETVLENFCVCLEGMDPQGLILFRGSFYGTSSAGGAYGYGNTFKLTDQNGVWKETVIYDFTGGSAGLSPQGNVIPDQRGHLYGTLLGGGGTQCGQLGCGTVFELKHSSAGGKKSCFTVSLAGVTVATLRRDWFKTRKVIYMAQHTSAAARYLRSRREGSLTSE